ncbi:MAG: nucleotidyl transferase AbiEii/AbiGii toxin family protein [Calditrichaceae bacterium]
MKDSIYFRQANLVLDILPLLEGDNRFAIKGGTAINFFIRSLPRLSVDIDLTYLPIEGRDLTLNNIDRALQELEEKIRGKFSAVQIHPKYSKENKLRCGLILSREQARIKIEPNLIVRGSVFPVEKRNLVEKAQDLFEKNVKIQSLSHADLYGSKLCAALDRQHPRDFFDIKLLLANEGITDSIHQAFIVYLISHNRSMIELLNPNEIDFDKTFEIEFKGMTFDDVSLKALKDLRSKLFTSIRSSLSETERMFLISFKAGQPDWKLLPLKKIDKLPAVQWKLQNIAAMAKPKHEAALNRLKEFLQL